MDIGVLAPRDGLSMSKPQWRHGTCDLAPFADWPAHMSYSLNSLKGGYRAIQGLGFRV